MDEMRIHDDLVHDKHSGEFYIFMTVLTQLYYCITICKSYNKIR